MREGYEKTKLGEIPVGWLVGDLATISDVIMGQSPKSSSYNEDGEGVPFFQGKADFGNIFPYTRKWTTEPIKISETMDILITVRAPVGDVNINNIKSCIGRGLSAIRPKNNKSNYKFLYYYLLNNKAQFDRSSQGSTFTAINSVDLNTFKVIVPPLPEQQKIAEILSTVDEQIEQTDQLIEKTKELKKGLMQKLLTKGIGHTKFKKTEIGEIPEEWKVYKFGELFKFMKSGLSRMLKDEDIGIPCIRSTNIIENKISNSDLKYWYLEDDKGANIEDYVLNDGDVLINFINSIAQIGKSCIYRDIGRKAIYTTNIFRIKTDENKLLNDYFYYYTLTERYKKDISLITKPAINQASFTSVDFKNIKISVPSLLEQQKIASILSSVDEQIEQYETRKQKLEQLKKGLMQQLLTGKIRVKVS